MSFRSRTPGEAGDALTPVLQLIGQLQPALERRDRAKLRDVVAELVALRAPMGGQWEPLAGIAASIGELRLSRAAADLFVEASGGSASAQFHKAALLTESGGWSEAYAILSSLPDHVPNAASNAYSRGTSLVMLGRTDEAREQLERVVKLRPASASAWLGLAMITDAARDEHLLGRLMAAERSVMMLPPGDRAPYYYAVGKAHADWGEHRHAFAAFARAAQMRRGDARYDRAADAESARDAVRDYTAAGVAALAESPREPTGRAIFVTGLPRSGTTLVEQILTSHSQVSEGGEIGRLELLAREVGGSSFAAAERYVGTRGAQEAARLWAHWLDERFPAPGRVVDKTLDASRRLGLAAALLPDAPLVWVARDPLDRAWSCFRTLFTADLAWSYDLTDIAYHFQLEDALLARWQAVLGDRLLVVPYEALVGEPEVWIRRLLGHCRLDEEPQVFAPHENARPVATASAIQVRRPIDRSAVGSAEPYREFLQPFIDAYRA